LELAFDSKRLRTICESEAEAECEIGVIAAANLKHRLSDLCAATSVSDLVIGQPRLVDGTNGQRMTLNIGEGRRIVFCANHPNPKTETGQPDWAKVSRIKILEITPDNG
jgi:proteic killer suppression protein